MDILSLTDENDSLKVSSDAASIMSDWMVDLGRTGILTL